MSASGGFPVCRRAQFEHAEQSALSRKKLQTMTIGRSTPWEYQKFRTQRWNACETFKKWGTSLSLKEAVDSNLSIARHPNREARPGMEGTLEFMEGGVMD